MAKVLITGASTSKAYQVKSTLVTDQVILGDFENVPHVMAASGAMLKLPDPFQSSSYIHEMLALCLDKEISVILPVRKAESELLKEADQLFGEYGITIAQIDDAI